MQSNTRSDTLNKFYLRLQNSNQAVFVLYVSLASFIVYACMYGFRKPFTAASYDNITFFGYSYKVSVVVAQVIGYMLSKFYGIRFIARMNPGKRAITIVKLIFIAWLSLLLFAVVPAPYNIVFMFINGLPLGMVWGLVFGFLEGRRTTEMMGAILATSFIFASGLAKTVGKWLMLSLHVSEWWMPFAAGSIFVIPLLLSTWLLNRTPPPDAKDETMRTIRKPMDRQERIGFIKRFGFALAPMITAYALLTVLRDFSEDFANELWKETGYQKNAEIFEQTSTLTSLIVLLVIGAFFLIKNNYKAFQSNHIIIIFGFILAAGSTFLFHQHLISPYVWFLSATTGLYLGYVPYNCFYFERLLAAFKIAGNVGFLIYIADAFGYLGTVLVLLIKESVHVNYSWVSFFSLLFYVTSGAGILFVIWSALLFEKIYRK